MLGRLLRSGSWVILGLLLGRVSGLLRELLVAARFGATRDGDVAVFLMTVPDVLILLLVGGAMEAALIPEFRALPEAQARRLYRQATMVVGLAFGALAAAVALVPGPLVTLLAPGFAPDTAARSGELLAWSIGALPLTVVAAVCLAYLHAHDHFLVPSLGTVLYNLPLIAALGLAPPDRRLEALALAILAGAALRWVAQLLDMRRLPAPGGAGEGWLVSRELATRYVQALLGGGLLYLLPSLARVFASFLPEGSVALLNFSQKLVLLPLGVCLHVFAVVLLPTLSGLYQEEGREEEAHALARHGVQLVAAVSLAVAATMAWFRLPLTRAVFGWGATTPEVLVRIAELMALGMLSLPAQGLAAMTQAIMNSRRDTRSPLVANLAGVLLYLPVAYAAHRTHGLEGLVLALVGVHWLTLAAHAVYLARRHGLPPGRLLEARLLARTAIAVPLGMAPGVLLGGAVAGGLAPDLAAAVLAGAGGLVAGLLADPARVGWLRARLAARAGSQADDSPDHEEDEGA